MELRKKSFCDWFKNYGPTPTKYIQALESPQQVISFRKINPSMGRAQAVDLDITKFPPQGRSIFFFTTVSEVKAIFEETKSFRVGDDGAMHTAIGYYALWLRLIRCEEWLDEPFWDMDCATDGSATGKTRTATLNNNGFDYLKELEYRKATYKMDKYLAAIRTKPFILLAGISGTGKSRMVRQLARGCCPAEGPLARDSKPGNFEMIQVRPNWHDSTELMGYVTRITANQKPKYVVTPFVRFLVKAWLNPEVPFFLCMDEMNLAPVEQYFAEYLSVIETRRRAIEKDVVPGCIKTDDVMTDILVSLNPEVLEGVLNELSEAIPLDGNRGVLTETQPTEVKKRDRDALYRQWDEFLAAWPISRLRTITLDEYTKAGSSDTFTYALEARYSQLGSIWGGSAFKFGIYSRNPNGKMKVYGPNSGQVGNDGYAWYSKYGSTQEAAWSVVKERVVAIAEAASRGDFAAVEKIDLPHVVKWKIAFLYQDRTDIKIVDIYKREWIYLLTANMPPKTSFADRYLKLNEERNGMDVFEWDDTVLTQRKNELLSAGGSSDADDDDDGDEEGDVEELPSSPIIDMIRKDGGIRIPPNLVVMGTVNMDETTCSFSRKVLDRAMTFELNDVSNMYTVDEINDEGDVPFGSIDAGLAKCSLLGAKVAVNSDEGKIELDPATHETVAKRILDYIKTINEKLEGTPFKIAYRSRDEIMIYCLERIKSGIVPLVQALDEATSMKILSRIEGDEQKFIHFKLDDFRKTVALALCKVDNPDAKSSDADAFIADSQKGGKSISLAKLGHMAQALRDGAGFVSFWE